MKIQWGDCLEQLKGHKDNTVDAVVTDPPYGLSFMGKKWDYDVPSVELWREVLRVLKPGGHLLSFGGTRTYHRMVVNIEDAGFEVRDQIMWIYGSGFPKSLNIDKAIDKAAGIERTEFKIDEDFLRRNPGKKLDGIDRKKEYSGTEFKEGWQGWGTALKPANEPIVLARKPIEKGLTVADNVLKWGTGALNIDGARIGYASEQDKRLGQSARPSTSKGYQAYAEGEHDQFSRADRSQITGRWPANVLFDEEAAEVLDAQSGVLKSGAGQKTIGGKKLSVSGWSETRIDGPEYNGDSGGASRFFLVVKRDPFDTTPACGQEKTRGADTFAGNKTASKKENLSTDGFGSKQTAQYLLTTMSIIRTETHSIITFPISNACTKMCIGHITIVSEKTIKSFSGESVESVQLVSDTEASVTLSNGQLEHIKGTVSIALDPHLENGETKTENTTTPITESIGASRFLYQAKTSKRERNAGLDSYERIVFDGSCKEENTVAVQLLQRVTLGSMAKWSIAECGERITATFPKECRSTIETESRAIIESKTLSLLMLSLTNESTPESFVEMGLITNPVDGAANTRPWLLSITNGKTELALGAVNVALEMLQKISESAVTQLNNFHSTVKPIKLMEYLCKLITPPGGVILDPFMGSGSTGCAATKLGFRFIGIEREKEYVEIAKKRIEHWSTEEGQLCMTTDL